METRTTREPLLVAIRSLRVSAHRASLTRVLGLIHPVEISLNDALYEV
jgi:hypothetical protein